MSDLKTDSFWKIYNRLSERKYCECYKRIVKGACGVMVIVVGNGHDDTSSNPGRDWLHFTLH